MVGSGEQGAGAGCAMKLGTSSPGINTDTPFAYTVICTNTQTTITNIKKRQRLLAHEFELKKKVRMVSSKLWAD